MRYPSHRTGRGRSPARIDKVALTAPAHAVRRRRRRGHRRDDRRRHRVRRCSPAWSRHGPSSMGNRADVRARAVRTVRSSTRCSPITACRSCCNRCCARPRALDAAVRVAGLSGWTRRNFARWLFEDYPRALLLTPRRWHREHAQPAFAPAERPRAQLQNGWQRQLASRSMRPSSTPLSKRTR